MGYTSFMAEINLELQPKQEEAFLSEATEILYGGAAFGGKSYLMRVALIWWCSNVNGLQCYLFRKTLPDLIANHIDGPGKFMDMLAGWIEAGHVVYNESKKRFKFWNGSAIYLRYCQYDKDALIYKGTDIHVLCMDELTSFSEFQYRFLRGRVRMVGVKVPEEYKSMFPRILCGSNPGDVGHNWVKTTFVDKSPNGEIIQTSKDEGGMRRQFIQAIMADNEIGMEEDPGYEDRLSGLGDPALVEAMKSGNWDIVAGGMFDDVWRKHVHVIVPFDIPIGWRIDRSFDWGSSKPFSVGWWAESDGTEVKLKNGNTLHFPRGTLFRIAEWYGWTGKANEGVHMLATEIAEGILRKEKDMNIAQRVVPGPADSSIYTVENGNDIAGDMSNKNIKWTKANKSPGSRKVGWELMRTRLKACLQTPMEAPGMFVFENCHQFIRTIPVLSRLERDRDDIDSNAEDHIADETRYRVLAAAPAKVEMKKLVGL